MPKLCSTSELCSDLTPFVNARLLRSFVDYAKVEASKVCRERSTVNLTKFIIAPCSELDNEKQHALGKLGMFSLLYSEFVFIWIVIAKVVH